jgi:hypothetical protein
MWTLSAVSSPQFVRETPGPRSSSWLKIYYENVKMLVAKSDEDSLSIG